MGDMEWFHLKSGGPRVRMCKNCTVGNRSIHIGSAKTVILFQFPASPWLHPPQPPRPLSNSSLSLLVTASIYARSLFPVFIFSRFMLHLLNSTSPAFGIFLSLILLLSLKPGFAQTGASGRIFSGSSWLWTSLSSEFQLLTSLLRML